jgi:K+-sensing histidine kinase KdpD/DNA-binding winged helix-turn-helix (wHTH) protein
VDLAGTSAKKLGFPGIALDETRVRAHLSGMNQSTIAPNDRWRASAPGLIGFAAALLMVAAATLIGLLIAPRWGNAPVVLLYLPPVLAAAIYCGLWPALVAAIASTLAYNFYFTAPYRTFVIHSPADVVTVVILFLVALVTSHLAGSLREQARLAAAHAARNATIAGLARRLLSCASEQDIADVAVLELSRLFGCNSVLMTGRDDPQLLASAPTDTALAPSDFAAAAVTLDTGEPTGRGVRRGNLADWQFRPVASEQAVMAAVGLARDDGTVPVGDDQLSLLENLLDQVALALERARLEREAREVAGLRERDRLRSVLLASIGEDVKPRLTSIISAARTLRRGGSSDQATLAGSIASEASKLDRYIDELVDLSPGSDQEPLEIGDVTIDLFRRSVLRNGEDVHLTPKEYSVLAELARHAGRVLTHAHLLRSVWGPAQEGQIEYLRVAVRALRQKLERDPASPELILNEPAVGYRLVAP